MLSSIVGVNALHVDLWLCISLRIGEYINKNTLMVSCFLGVRFDSWMGSPVVWVTHTLPLGLQWSTANAMKCNGNWENLDRLKFKVFVVLCVHTHAAHTHSTYSLSMVHRITGQVCFK